MTTADLEKLVGQELDTVSFVRDYVELRIDYSILRALTEPTGTIDGRVWRLTDDGAADLMRGYIGRTVSSVEFEEGDHIALLFESGVRIEVSLRDEDRVGPEAAHLVPADLTGQPDTARMSIW